MGKYNKLLSNKERNTPIEYVRALDTLEEFNELNLDYVETSMKE
ncbi:MULTISPECIES: hypothetical protein [Bacillus]|nr:MULTISPECIES: hypothetical protein [Bacillus cereus group]EEM38440.1 hypothetical protein bthur0004_56700 [Bacillus thuringiensis serovar sotto str. T04001]MCU5139780.1 hypothetical protein [Bacillus cereus]MEC3390801.1 hypothetical protein [Bacillus thuringiensis]MED2269689.1 hypothetical protein [Bacillus thuringiensis]MED2417377.1 hypothetical protein [Bacillus thuringiensis]